MSDLTAVSLFAGIEGIGLALERAGVRVVASVEIDPDCRSVIARHFPQTTLFDDVRTVTGDQLRAAGFVPGRGIITGGFPCQDLSIAGRRAGLGGARSGLFWEIMRLADELRPRWLLLENVPGLLSAVCPCPGDGTCVAGKRAVRCGEWRGTGDHREWFPDVPHQAGGGACAGGCMAVHGGAMGTVLGAVGKRGYGIAYRILDAQHFGVPQRRRRVFIAGCLGDWAAPVEVLLEPEGGEGHPAAGRKAGSGVARAPRGNLGKPCITGTLTAGSLADYDDNTARAGFMITAPTVTAREGKGPDSDATSGFIVAPTLTAGWGTNRGAPGNGGKDDAALAVIASTLQGGGRRGHRVDAEGAAGGQLIAFDAAQITSGENRANPQPGDPTPTLAAQGQPMLAYPLDLRNAARSSEAGETAGTGIGEDGDPCFTISATSRALPGVATFGGEGVRDALTAEGADASEDGTGRGTPIVTVPMAFNPQTGGSRGRLGSMEPSRPRCRRARSRESTPLLQSAG